MKKLAYKLSKDVHNDDKSVPQCFCEIFLLEASDYTKFLMWNFENQLLVVIKHDIFDLIITCVTIHPQIDAQ